MFEKIEFYFQDYISITLLKMDRTISINHIIKALGDCKLTMVNQIKNPNQIIKIRSDNWVCANDMSKLYGKAWKNFGRLENTKFIIKSLKIINKIEQISEYEDRGRENRRTWIHPDFAIIYAHYLDPLFSVFMAKVVNQTYGPQNSMQMLEEISKDQENQDNSGYIYCITAPRIMKPNIFKIGKSQENQEDLVQQYSRQYGPDIIVKLYLKVANRHDAENKIKYILDRYRIGESEIVECDFNIINNAFSCVENIHEA